MKTSSSFSLSELIAALFSWSKNKLWYLTHLFRYLLSETVSAEFIVNRFTLMGPAEPVLVVVGTGVVSVVLFGFVVSTVVDSGDGRMKD